MTSIYKTIVTGIILLAISGINVYLPSVGNMFDTWRVAFSFVMFFAGCIFLIRGLVDFDDSLSELDKRIKLQYKQVCYMRMWHVPGIGQKCIFRAKEENI